MAPHLRAAGAVDGPALRHLARRGVDLVGLERRGAQSLRDAVPRTALRTPLRCTTLLEVARQVLAIAQAGLQRARLRQCQGRGRAHLPEPVEVILRDGLTPPTILLRYERDWGGAPTRSRSSRPSSLASEHKHAGRSRRATG
jgi:gamma-glutamylcysteine synthetase